MHPHDRTRHEIQLNVCDALQVLNSEMGVSHDRALIEERAQSLAGRACDAAVSVVPHDAIARCLLASKALGLPIRSGAPSLVPF